LFDEEVGLVGQIESWQEEDEASESAGEQWTGQQFEILSPSLISVVDLQTMVVRICLVGGRGCWSVVGSVKVKEWKASTKS